MHDVMYSSGLVDCMLVIIVAEFFFLFAKDRRFAFSLLPFFCAGAALILALRVVILQGAWQYLAMFLILALIAHLLELYRRLKNKDRLLQR